MENFFFKKKLPYLFLYLFVLSRYHYWRQNSKNMFKKMMDRGDPWMNENVTLESWKEKDIEQCIFEQDPECYFVDGEAYDLTIVNWGEIDFG